MKNNFRTLTSGILTKASTLFPKKDDVYTKDEVATKAFVNEALSNLPTNPGSGGTISWNDLTDKPFCEVPRNYEITWDGDMTDKMSIDLSNAGYSGGYLVKVSDKVYTKEELVGKIYADNTGYPFIIDDNTIDEDYAPGAIIEVGFSFAVIYSAEDFNAAFGLPDGYCTNGTYFACAPSLGAYISALYTEGRIEKLNDKYLPDTILRIAHNIDDNGLKCVLDGGWSRYTPTWGKDSPWGESPSQLRGKILNVAVKVNVSENTYYTVNAVFSLMLTQFDVGTYYYWSHMDVYGTVHVWQLFIRIEDAGDVYIAAKTVEI